MIDISFSRFIENTEPNLSKSYYPLGGFNPGSENYGVLNEVNQANLEKAYKGKITNSTVYIDQVETNWMMQFESVAQAHALRILYSEVLMDAKKLQMQEVKRMGKDPNLLADLSRPEGFEVWEESLAVLKDHTFNPTSEFQTKNKKGIGIPSARGYETNFDFGDLPTGAMYLIDKLERPVNTKLLQDLENQFKEDPKKAKEEYQSEKNPQRGVCGYNLHYDPEEINYAKGKREDVVIFKNFQAMKQSQANDIVSSYREDVKNGLMGNSARIGDIDAGVQFKKTKGGSPARLPKYQRDFEGNFYINEQGSQHLHVLDIETIESLVESGHPSFKNIEIKTRSQLKGKPPKKLPIDKRTGKEFWPHLMPNGFSTASSAVRDARMDHQDVMGIRQNGKFVGVKIPQKNSESTYTPSSGMCYAQILEKSLTEGFTGKVPPENIAEHTRLDKGLGDFNKSLNTVQDKLIDPYFVQHIVVNRPAQSLVNADGKELSVRTSVGKGSGYFTLGGAVSGNVTETNPLDPADPDSVLLSNIMDALIIYKDDKTVGKVVYDSWTKDKDGNTKTDMKASPAVRERLLSNESKYVEDIDQHVLYFNAGTPTILLFLKGFLKALRDLLPDEEKVKNYILNGLKNDKSEAKEAINSSTGLKNVHSKAYATAKQKALSYLNSISQEGLDHEGRDGKKYAKPTLDRGALDITAEVETEAENKGISADANSQHEAWTNSVKDLISLVDLANKNRNYPEGLEIEGNEVLWFPWVVNKFKEKIGITGESEAIKKISEDKNYNEMVKDLLISIDPKFKDKLDASVKFPKNQAQPQQQQPQQPQQPQQQTGSYEIPELKNYANITGLDGVGTAKDLRDKLNTWFSQTNYTSPQDIPNNLYKTPFIQKAVELGFPGFEDRPDEEEIVNMQGKENIEKNESMLYASKDDLISILSESNGEVIFETIKEQLALRKDVCEIIASSELEKQRINQ